MLSPEEIARRRLSGGKYLHRRKPRPGYIGAAHALEVVQIDHTPADIQFVEVIDGHGVFVGRPYLTIAADVATSAIMGFCLTLERPSRLSVALCLAHAICLKDDWLLERGIAHPWAMNGRPKQIVVDSAKEIQSSTFTKGCADFGITARTRNKGTVHRGGVVERLLGKVNTVLRSLPGKTGRSIADRGDYSSDKRASLTFAALERLIDDLLRLDSAGRAQDDRKSLAARLSRYSVPVGPGTSTIPYLSHRVRYNFFRQLSERQIEARDPSERGPLTLWDRPAPRRGKPQRVGQDTYGSTWRDCRAEAGLLLQRA